MVRGERAAWWLAQEVTALSRGSGSRNREDAGQRRVEAALREVLWEGWWVDKWWIGRLFGGKNWPAAHALALRRARRNWA